MTCSAQRAAIRPMASMATLLLALAMPAWVLAQNLTVLHSFTNNDDGSFPAAGVIMDRAGNLYGATSAGNIDAAGNFGRISSAFELKAVNSGWLLKPLSDFHAIGSGGADGYALATKPVFGPDGALYASAQQGGVDNCDSGCGTVVRMQPSPTACASAFCLWNVTVLYYFAGTPDGAYPDQLVFGSDGNIYGTTLIGGITGGSCGTAGCGTVFVLTNSGGRWIKSTLFAFNGTNGNGPAGGITFDAAGNAYGVTLLGGSHGTGVAYKLTPVLNGFWTQTILYAFQAQNDGQDPLGPLTADAAGNLYGVAFIGGSGGGGTVFELSPPGTWNLLTLYSFSSDFGSLRGGLLLDSAGSIYGATYGGGIDNQGTLYKLTQSNGIWSYSDLYDFSESDGYAPNGGLIFDANGNIYGTSFYGGADEYGTAWKFTP